MLLVRLGGLFLRDLATEGTMFPLLVFPNPVCPTVMWVSVYYVCFRKPKILLTGLILTFDNWIQAGTRPFDFVREEMLVSCVALTLPSPCCSHCGSVCLPGNNARNTTALCISCLTFESFPCLTAILMTPLLLRDFIFPGVQKRTALSPLIFSVLYGIFFASYGIFSLTKLSKT